MLLQCVITMLCPVDAYINWITVAGIAKGPVFQRIDRWGNLSGRAMQPHSLIPVLRRIFKEAGLPAELYSSHSMRRGFATWASANGWDIKGLMSYVGWKDMKSALRYVDASVSFGGIALRADQHVPVTENNRVPCDNPHPGADFKTQLMTS